MRPDADAEDYFTRITTAGGTISAATKAATHRLVQDLKQGNVWNSLFDVGLLAGDQLAAALVKLKHPAGVQSTLTNVNFISGDYTEATGLKGNGTTKRLRTGVLGNVLPFVTPNYRGSLAAYVRSVTAYAEYGIAAGVLVGTANGNSAVDSAATYLAMDSFDGATFAHAGEALGTVAISADPPGLIVGVATSLAARRVYLGGTAQTGSRDTGSAAGDALNFEFYVMAENQGGTAARFADQHLAFYSIGDVLSDAQVAALHNAVQLFQQTLGRSV